MLLETGKQHQKAPRKDINEQDAKDMLVIREIQGLTWAEIGSMYGISGCAAYRRVERLFQRIAG